MKLPKLLTLLLSVSLVLCFAGCGGGGGGGGSGSYDDDSSGDSDGSGVPLYTPWLCFTSTGDSTVRIDISGSLDTLPILEFSNNGVNWSDFPLVNGGSSSIIILENGGKGYLRAKSTNSSFSKDDSNYAQFVMTGSVAASGNIMSLLDKNCSSVTIPADNCFNHLFSGCTVLTTSPDLTATTLTSNCYKDMFNGCSALKSIKVFFTGWIPADATTSWVDGVSDTSSVKFYHKAALDVTAKDINHVLSNWSLNPF